MHDLGLVRRIRQAIESFIPWFDRAVADRERADLTNELAKSRATRAFAREEMLRGSFNRAGKRLGHR